jgi:hypothetical protein
VRLPITSMSLPLLLPHPFSLSQIHLLLAMCMAVGPPALVVSFDSMLEELAAVLAMSGALEATSLRTAEPSTAGNDSTTGFTEPAMAMAQEPPQLTPPASEVAPVEVASRPSEMETATRDVRLNHSSMSQCC